MNTLPKTSEKHYLTGSSALNIPTEDGDFSDWHFTETFFKNKAKFKVAGRNFIDTSNLFGDYGVKECSDTLRRYGLTIEAKVYVANHIRAVLDMIYKNISEETLPSHIVLDDIFDDEKPQKELLKQLEQIKSKITDKVQLTLLNQWEKQQ
ncbi:MAG: hypothetical protein E6Q89_05885 [Bacteroidia bacterium]|nr:MAG: hypothetical protein E6Q89_05885 [Bacteroidia bacterium]